MSYRCGICGEYVESGVLMKRHIIKKPDGQIKQEIPVCTDCKTRLESGYTFEQVRNFRRAKPKGNVAAAVQSLPRVSPPTVAPRPRLVFPTKRLG